MNQHIYIAHVRKSDDQEQSVQEHLLETSTLCGEFAGKTDAGASLAPAGRLLGLLHDFGKYSHAFQGYIRSATDRIDPEDEGYVDPVTNKGKIDHSTAGAQFLWNDLRLKGRARELMALVIASHHSGLIDCVAPGGSDKLTTRVEKLDDKTHFKQAAASCDAEIPRKAAALIEGGAGEALSAVVTRILDGETKLFGSGASRTVVEFKIGLLARFLLSCLVDADRVNSAEFEYPARRSLWQAHPGWPVLIERLERALGGMAGSDRSIDALRRQVSDECRVAAERERRVFTLTVPTGGGKTLASLRFALHHAKRHGLEHVIYVIPYTSIIDQNAQAAREILEPQKDEIGQDTGIAPGSVVLEHHSNLDPERQDWRHAVLSENWDAPVIFTTSVQLLEALFGAGCSPARRMHRLAKSVIIFDEAQTIPLRCVHLFNNAVNFLVEHAGSSVVLMTATQPLLETVDPAKGAARVDAGSEIVGDVDTLFQGLKRVDVHADVEHAKKSPAEVATLMREQAIERGSCLAIVNTRKSARALYDACRDASGGGFVPGESLFHLSTFMCPEHRTAKLKLVKARLAAGEPVLCVSTQLIEAGVDISFASVVRYAAGCDSVAQAAGRCNRNGELEGGELGQVFVVNPTDEQLDPWLKELEIARKKGQEVIREVADHPDTYSSGLLDPKAIQQYFKRYFRDRERDMGYPTQVRVGDGARSDSLLSLLGDNGKSVQDFQKENSSKEPPKLRQAFQTAAGLFQAIDAPTQAVITPYGRGRDLIAELCAQPDAARSAKLLREAQRYSVNIFRHTLAALQQAGAVSEIREGTGPLVLRGGYYSDEFGLSETPTGPQEVLCA